MKDVLSPTFVGAAITALGILGTYLGIRFTVKGTRKSKEIDARVAQDQSAMTERKESYDQVQENLSGAWEEARKLRSELELTSTKYRNEIAELWRQLADVRRQADYEIAQIRSHYRIQKEDDELYITALVTHINTGQPPPAPPRPAAREVPSLPPLQPPPSQSPTQ